jgi:transcription elongation factor GreA
MNRAPTTAAGAERLKVELPHLKSVVKPRIVQDISTVREHGDLKENAKYHVAREQQRFCDGGIQEIESVLSMAQVIDVEDLDTEEDGDTAIVITPNGNREYEIFDVKYR